MAKIPPRIYSKKSTKGLMNYLKTGGIIAYPTESCYGIGAAPRCVRGLKAVLRLKKRPQHKGMIVIGNSLKQLEPLLGKIASSDRERLDTIWPAPKTFILPSASNTPIELRGRQRRNKLAVRVPDHAVACNLCKLVKQPLVSTSCNRAGRKPCRTAREVYRQFGKKLWIISGRIGHRRTPSELIDWDSQVRLR